MLEHARHDTWHVCLGRDEPQVVITYCSLLMKNITSHLLLLLHLQHLDTELARDLDSPCPWTSWAVITVVITSPGPNGLLEWQTFWLCRVCNTLLPHSAISPHTDLSPWSILVISHLGSGNKLLLRPSSIFQRRIERAILYDLFLLCSDHEIFKCLSISCFHNKHLEKIYDHEPFK